MVALLPRFGCSLTGTLKLADELVQAACERIGIGASLFSGLLE